MSDNQILIPPSFMALYTDPVRHKLLASHSEVLARYEFCEDMAQLLTETAKEAQFGLGLSEQAVLERVTLGLHSEPAVCTPDEANWVRRRLAELLNWPAD